MIVHNIKDFKTKGFSIEKLEYMKSFDFDINYIVGGRSNYKTSTLQVAAIDDYKKKGVLSIRLLRFDVDTKTDFIENFFSDYAKRHAFVEYNALIEFKKKGYYLVYYDDDGNKLKEELFMKVVALAKAQKFKSNGLEDYNIIIFDEFAPEDDIYLTNEVNKLISFISTVNRLRPSGLDGLKVYLIGNMISVDNLYFDTHHIDAMQIKANHLYDYSVDGYQRIGLFCVEPVTESFEDAPRILRTIENNTQETHQTEYEVPKDILTTDYLFINLLLNDKEKFYKRFYIKHLIDIYDNFEHVGYLYFWCDKFDDRTLYVFANKEITKNVYCVYSKEYNESHTTHTNFNSPVDKPVMYVNSKNLFFADTNTRRTFFKYFGG